MIHFNFKIYLFFSKYYRETGNKNIEVSVTYYIDISIKYYTKPDYFLPLISENNTNKYD